MMWFLLELMRKSWSSIRHPSLKRWWRSWEFLSSISLTQLTLFHVQLFTNLFYFINDEVQTVFFLFCFSFDNKPNQLAFSQVLLFQNLFKYIFSKGLTRYSINNKVCKYTTIPTRVSLLNFQSGACNLKVHQKSSSEE